MVFGIIGLGYFCGERCVMVTNSFLCFDTNKFLQVIAVLCDDGFSWVYSCGWHFLQWVRECAKEKRKKMKDLDLIFDVERWFKAVCSWFCYS